MRFFYFSAHVALAQEEPPQLTKHPTRADYPRSGTRPSILASTADSFFGATCK